MKIITPVNHRKTTLVNKILKSCEVFKEHELLANLFYNNNELERKRGIIHSLKKQIRSLQKP